MLTLYDFAASANCFKVRMLLSQLGIAYDRVAVDIFAGESQTDSFLARNPAGRTPLLETSDGVAIPESGAILLYLAEGTPFLPADPVERAHVHAWMFFEQNLLEPNVGTARFWRLTGRDTERPEAFARHVEAGAVRSPRWSAGWQGETSSSATATPSPTVRCTPTPGSRTRPGTTWPSYPAREGVARPSRGDAGRARRPRALPGGGIRRRRRPLGPRPTRVTDRPRPSSSYAVRSCASSSNAATKPLQSSIVWVMESVHSSSRPGVMKMPRFML